jgi:cytochrome c5
MRLRLDTLFACSICLTGITSACRPASGQAGDDVATQMAAPRPSAVLQQVVAESEKASAAALPEGTGRALVEGNCLICHGAALIQQQHKDSAGWAKTVKQMRTWGAPLAEQDEPALIAYLVKSYGIKEP